METLPEDVKNLLADLAQESRETVEELLTRLIKAEHFSRHFTYNALSGNTTPKQCMCLECFMER